LVPDERWKYLREKGRMGKRQVVGAFRSPIRVDPSAPLQLVDFHYFKTLIRYRPKPYSGRLTLLLSEDIYAYGRAFGWRRWVDGGLEIRRLPGNHFSYIREHVATAAAQILICLQQAQALVSSSRADRAPDSQAGLPPPC
jgi:thioesterase domain-containing protein